GALRWARRWIDGPYRQSRRSRRSRDALVHVGPVKVDDPGSGASLSPRVELDTHRSHTRSQATQTTAEPRGSARPPPPTCVRPRHAMASTFEDAPAAVARA